jgi:hypothetical protein
LDDDDQELHTLTKRKTGSRTGWNQLGALLLKIGQFDENDEAFYYNQLGFVKTNEGDYKKTIWYYKNSLEINKKKILILSLNCASIY